MDKACLPVLVDDREAMWIEPRGAVVLKAGSQDNPQVKRVYETAIRTSAQVYEYTEAMSAAPLLKADGLHEDFRLLAEFNGIVLAGQELERDWGYKFVTWRRDGDGTGVAHGNYYHNGYEAAKLDFACRSGLVQESRQFTDEQLAELYRSSMKRWTANTPLPKSGAIRSLRPRIRSSGAWMIWRNEWNGPTNGSWRQRSSRQTAGRGWRWRRESEI